MLGTETESEAGGEQGLDNGPGESWAKW